MNPTAIHEIRKPLVAMIGIGTYPNGGALGDLKGIPNDYRRMIRLFVKHFGYSMMYRNHRNETQYLAPEESFYNKNYKLKWSSNEIANFAEEVKSKVIKTQPDSLIFIISSHGDRDKVIYDSYFEEISLLGIYSIFWNEEESCPYLANKPKIFIVDACQGMLTPVPHGILKKRKGHISNSNTDNSNIISNGNGTKQSESNVINLESDLVEIAKEKNMNDNDSEENEVKGIDTSEEETVTEKAEHVELTDMKHVDEAMSKSYLRYEYFCYIYANIDDYRVADGGPKGGYLLQALSNTLLQENAPNTPLSKIITQVRDETLRLVKGEPKRWKSNYKQSKHHVRQIVECTDNISGELYFVLNHAK